MCVREWKVRVRKYITGVAQYIKGVCSGKTTRVQKYYVRNVLLRDCKYHFVYIHKYICGYWEREDFQLINKILVY